MPVYDSQKEGIVVITVDGDHTTAELKRVGAAALDRPGVPSPARVLLDVSGAASLKNRSPEDLRDTATFFADLPGLQAVAVLAPDDLSYSLMRMGMTFFRANGMRASVFRSRPEAMAWLKEPAA